eukprot:m.64640 g.64640  ORF g.64640 m.64640 type:complete len:361 (+) comp9727_c0_seq4:52-1134(+)
MWKRPRQLWLRRRTRSAHRSSPGVLLTSSQTHTLHHRIPHPYKASIPHCCAVPRYIPRYPIKKSIDVRLKMESLQRTGSFKIRGMVNAFNKIPRDLRSKGVVTMSAGNAGKSFSTLAKAEQLDALVIMPDSVPIERRAAMEALGSTVEVAPLQNLQQVVNNHVLQHGRRYVAPYDDLALIAGHGSVGLEILEDFPDVEVVLVCCGGGGLVSGVAAAVKMKAGDGVRVYAVEPEGAPTMALSVKAGSPQPYDPALHGTHAHGLAAPYAGPISFEHVKKFVDGVLLVSDEELAAAARVMYELGFVAETAGCAGVAAVLFDKVRETPPSALRSPSIHTVDLQGSIARGRRQGCSCCDGFKHFR